MAGQVGIAPADVDRSDLFGVLSMLGVHRHPRYWLSNYELAPDDDEVDEPLPRGRADRPIRSERGTTPGTAARRDSKQLFEARRRAARGEAPPPEPAPPSAGAVSVASMLTGGRLTGGA